MGFREFLDQQLTAAHDAASAADELHGEGQLGEWWRWRVIDLEGYLDDIGPAPAD